MYRCIDTDTGRLDTYTESDTDTNRYIHFSVSPTMNATGRQKHEVHGAWSMIYWHRRPRPTDEPMLLIVNKIFCLPCLL